jgi:hypothetical protein
VLADSTVSSGKMPQTDLDITQPVISSERGSEG